jgi:glycosyltransferase involved in cell wall biosynthesis
VTESTELHIGMWPVPAEWWSFSLDWARAAAQFAHVVGFQRGSPGGAVDGVRVNSGIEVLSWDRRLTLRPSRPLRPVNTRLDVPPMIAVVRDHEQASEKRLDLLHSHWFAESRHIPHVARSLGIPFVHTEHSSVVTRQNPDQTMSRLAMRSKRLVFRKAAVVIAVSEYLGKAILDNIGECNIVVIPNPVDTSLFACREQCRPPGDKVVVTHVAPLNRVKRQDMLLRAFEKLTKYEPDARLQIIGDGPQKTPLMALTRDLGLGDRVNFRGQLSRREVAAALAGTHLLCMASATETCSVAVLEALCSGVPVVTTPTGAFSEHVSETNGCVASGDDVASLANALWSVVSNLGRFDRGAIAANAAAKYSLAAVGRQIAAVYSQVTSQPFA